jgi:magnesium chelatase subunit I
LLPEVPRSLCASGCLPEDIESGGIDAVCAECARKYGQGEPLTYLDRVRLVELPLNARLEDVVGGFDERLGQAGRWRLRRGLLARADRNLLYVDEANLLPDEIVDAILDAAAQGVFTVQRGSLSATYWARLALIGSMNPEEGSLRPQILDRFGLRVIVRGLATPDERLEAYRRSVAFRNSPRQLIARFASDTALAAQELATARQALPQVALAPPAEAFGLQLVRRMGIDSLRAEITLFEAARAYASADGRQRAEADDVRVVAPMALRLRGSAFLRGYLRRQNREEARLRGLLAPARPVLRKHKEPARAGSRKVRPRPG